MHETLSLRPGTRRLLRILCFLCLVACLCFIFGNSLQGETASDERSEEVTNAFHSVGLGINHDAVRKTAHFLEYTVLGLLALCCLRVLTPHLERHLAWPLLFGLLAALIDETIQLFVPGRSGLVADLWFDFGGIIAGVLLGAGFIRLTRKFWDTLSLEKQ